MSQYRQEADELFTYYRLPVSVFRFRLPLVRGVSDNGIFMYQLKIWILATVKYHKPASSKLAINVECNVHLALCIFSTNNCSVYI